MGNGLWVSGARTVRSVIIDDRRDAAALSGQGEKVMETSKTSLIYHLAPYNRAWLLTWSGRAGIIPQVYHSDAIG